ncbi:type II secretion system major pseudopilin GspG [Hydrogenimonas urashimensis]|uniref:type II secretion system major pseudopilin GspG n=1 Tax=Hydrogenimonas urashimensis TaxID=2740515 RepID=UPI0019154495|nr:type II secretion system major pseudopilin GspG [Hydrogenimonas urashimensis]
MKSTRNPLTSNRTKKRKAFSLLELMIVIIILGLLSALVLPNLLGKAESAKRKLVCIQMKQIQEALKSFKFDNGMYPTTEEGLEALLKNPDPEKYTNYAPTGYLESKALPRDPWKHPYVYISDGTSVNIISLGADGREGGEGDAKDITLQECERQ